MLDIDFVRAPSLNLKRQIVYVSQKGSGVLRRRVRAKVESLAEADGCLLDPVSSVLASALTSPSFLGDPFVLCDLARLEQANTKSLRG